MLLRTLPRAFALSSLALFALSSAAHAQRAPIVYAEQGETVSTPDRLEGGSENSYGYGSRSPGREAAVIDLRRPASTQRARVTEVADQPLVPLRIEAGGNAPTNVAVEEGTPAWLERERVGPPYEANGRWYVPTPEPGYAQTGTASWYGPQFHGRTTASGEVFDETALTAAHPTLPIPSLVQVTNLENGREVIVRVNDRGPFVGERLIDLSRGAAQVLGFEAAGHANVHVRYLGPAPRRVNASEAATPALAVSPAPRAAQAQQGPQSLLPPSSAAMETELAGAPVGVYQPTSASAPPARTGAYYVQIGAFSDLANAHRVRDQVGAAGPVVVDVRRSASGTELFRVRVGPWNTAEEANAARRRLTAMGYGETIVAAR